MSPAAAAHETAWSYAEQFVAEDDFAAEARRQAEQLGATPPSQAAGAALRLLAAAVDARSVVEIGAGTGVSSLWLLGGMPADAVLTSIDLEPQQQRVARELLTAAGFTGSRVRMISDYPLNVLPRLADGSYDLVYLDVLSTATEEELDSYLAEAVRLLRRGGVVVLDKVLGHEASDPMAIDAHSVAVRRLCDGLREDERLVPALLPVGGGLLCAARR